MKLSKLTEHIDSTERIGGTHDPQIAAIGFDSRTVVPGSLFFAVEGTQSDGHDYMDAAIDKGAVAIICRRLPENPRPETIYLRVDDPNAAMGTVADEFYGHPSRKLKLVGITGTNGKTTTATLLSDLFHKLGYRTGLISTVIYRIGEEEIPSTHTTPDVIRINEMLARMVADGCAYCFMEVSSHSIVQERIGGLHFTGAIFTNITHDHLDYHKTFAEYIRAKKLFFDHLPQTAFALTNTDDRNGTVMVQNTKAEIKTYSLHNFADFQCRIIETIPEGMLLEIDGNEVWVKFLGGFNASNLTAVYACACLLGADKQEVLTVLSDLNPVRGRFETIRSASGITAIIDYAHTPDALQNVIRTIDEIRREESRLIVVVGCGGDRDRTKRPEMARIAVEGADLAIFTSDNPRTEDPEAILADMKAGVTDKNPLSYMTVTDRRAAIQIAITTARKGDIILIAGKGHETYQIIGQTKHHFDDREEVVRLFGFRQPQSRPTSGSPDKNENPSIPNCK